MTIEHRVEQLHRRALKALTNALENIRMGSPAQRKTDEWWTLNIKTALCELGQNEALYVSAGSVGPNYVNNKEWLYDVTWADYGPTGFPDQQSERRLRNIVLALESELGNLGDILDDFEKLVQSTAAIRIMAFIKRSDDEFPARCQLLREVVDRYENHTRASYILVGFPEDSENDLSTMSFNIEMA